MSRLGIRVLPGPGLRLALAPAAVRPEMEVFAGYSENADWNVGRLLDAIAEMRPG